MANMAGFGVAEGLEALCSSRFRVAWAPGQEGGATEGPFLMQRLRLVPPYKWSFSQHKWS